MLQRHGFDRVQAFPLLQGFECASLLVASCDGPGRVPSLAQGERIARPKGEKATGQRIILAMSGVQTDVEFAKELARQLVKRTDGADKPATLLVDASSLDDSGAHSWSAHLLGAEPLELVYLVADTNGENPAQALGGHIRQLTQILQALGRLKNLATRKLRLWIVAPGGARTYRYQSGAYRDKYQLSVSTRNVRAACESQCIQL
ncbi:MAG: hypothetical protein L3J67_10320 [Hyphomicrobiaceae bacterium]|nr:hypothetical protein [Hyphomicrobiaceae bacterium]